MRPLLTLALLASLAGCKSRLFEPDAPGTDGSCPLYLHHYLEAAPLARLEPVDPVPTINRAVRVRAGVPLRPGCDLLGEIDATVMPGNATDFITLVAHRWRSASDDCPSPVTVARVVLLPDGLSNLRLAIRDGAENGTLGLSLPARLAPEGCTPAELSAPCQRDCQCKSHPTARCVERGDGSATCQVPCNDSADCASAGLASCHPLTSVCDPSPGCRTDADCPFGQRCPFGHCLPSQLALPDAPCGCDADCGFGGICKLTVDLGYCVVPCSATSGCLDTAECVQSQCLPRER